MVHLTRPLFALLLVSLATPLAAQRQTGSSPSAPARSSPSVGSSGGGFSRSAPAPAPRMSSPAPAARPSYQNPSPRPSAPAPSASPRPSFQNPSPRPSAPAPSASPKPTYQNPSPRPAAPAPSATPRPTTSNWAAGARPATPPATSRPSNTTTWSSRPAGGGSTSTNGGTITRPVDGTKPVGGNVARPTTGSAGTVVTRPDTSSRLPGAASNRYRPTQPDAVVSKPVARDPGVTTKPATREPGRVYDKPGLSPRQPAERPAVSKPLAGDRYGARPAATKPLASRPVVADKPLATQRPLDTVARRPASRPATTVAPVAPRLTPRPTSATRLPNRTAFYDQNGRTGGRVYGTPGSYYHYDNCHRAVWCDYWNPWPRSCWWQSPGWSFGWYGGAFAWNVSFGYPYWYCRTSYWYGCYGDAFWCGWSRPWYPASCYWWYPTTVYCPTYLYVPSTVYVPTATYVTQTVVSEPVEDQPAPQATVIAAGGVSSRVVVRQEGAGAQATNAGLAQKYVELGDFYFREHRFRDAAEAYGKARAQVPDDASVHLVLADAVFADGDYHYAAFLVGEAVRLDPTIASAATDKRTFYGDVKVFYAQMQALDAYLEKAPFDAQAHFVKGYNLRFSARREEATKAFQRVLEIEPGHRGAEAFLTAPEPAAAPAAAPQSEASEIR